MIEVKARALLRDNDKRRPANFAVVDRVINLNGDWYAQYSAGTRKAKVRFDRIKDGRNGKAGATGFQGWTLIKDFAFKVGDEVKTGALKGLVTKVIYSSVGEDTVTVQPILPNHFQTINPPLVEEAVYLSGSLELATGEVLQRQRAA